MVSKISPLARNKYVITGLLLVMVFLLSAVSCMAQTPMPTLYIPTNDIIEATNSWTPQLSRLISVGTGAAIAITLILFVAGILIMAIRGALKQAGFLGGGR